jgi:hypothetical protein
MRMLILEYPYSIVSLFSGFLTGLIYGVATMMFRADRRLGNGGPVLHVLLLGVAMSIIFLLSAFLLFSSRLMSDNEVKDFIVAMGFWLSGSFFLFELCRFIVLNFLRRN